MVISFKSTFKEPSNRAELVMFKIRLAAMLFMLSKGFSGPLPTPPSPDVTALLGLTRWLLDEGNTFFPVLEGGRALETLLQMSTKA